MTYEIKGNSFIQHGSHAVCCPVERHAVVSQLIAHVFGPHIHYAKAVRSFTDPAVIRLTLGNRTVSLLDPNDRVYQIAQILAGELDPRSLPAAPAPAPQQTPPAPAAPAPAPRQTPPAPAAPAPAPQQTPPAPPKPTHDTSTSLTPPQTPFRKHTRNVSTSPRTPFFNLRHVNRDFTPDLTRDPPQFPPETFRPQGVQSFSFAPENPQLEEIKAQLEALQTALREQTETLGKTTPTLEAPLDLRSLENSLHAFMTETRTALENVTTPQPLSSDLQKELETLRHTLSTLHPPRLETVLPVQSEDTARRDEELLTQHTELQKQLVALRAQIARMQEQLTSLERTSPTPQTPLDLSPLENKLDAFIEETRAAFADLTRTPSPPQILFDLEEQIQELRAQIPTPTDLGPLEDKLDACIEEMRAHSPTPILSDLQAQIEALRTLVQTPHPDSSNVQKMGEQIDRLEEQMAQLIQINLLMLCLLVSKQNEFAPGSDRRAPSVIVTGDEMPPEPVTSVTELGEEENAPGMVPFPFWLPRRRVVPKVRYSPPGPERHFTSYERLKGSFKWFEDWMKTEAKRRQTPRPFSIQYPHLKPPVGRPPLRNLAALLRQMIGRL